MLAAQRILKSAIACSSRTVSGFAEGVVKSHGALIRRHSPVKQWKVALSLAILAAIAPPFVTHTVRMRSTTETWIPLTQDEKERISAELSKTSNCRTLSEQFDAKKNMGIKPSVEDFMDVISRDSICRDQLKSLELGAYVESHPSILKFAAFNLASALAGFGIVFGAAMVILF